jgi:hypothetical protein
VGRNSSDDDGMIRFLCCEAGVPIDLLDLAYSLSMIGDNDKKLMFIVGLQDRPSLKTLAYEIMHPAAGEYQLSFRSSFPILGDVTSRVNSTLPQYPKSVTLVPGGECMSIQTRWDNWRLYAPTHVSMFHKLKTTLDLWIDLLFVMNTASVEFLYVTDRVENIFNSDPNNPYLTKYFRSSVMPKCYEMKANGRNGAAVSIYCHNLNMLHWCFYDLHLPRFLLTLLYRACPKFKAKLNDRVIAEERAIWEQFYGRSSPTNTGGMPTFQWVSEADGDAEMLEDERMQRPLREDFASAEGSDNTHLVKPQRTLWHERFIYLFKIAYGKEVPSTDFPLKTSEYYAIRLEEEEVYFKHPFTGEVNCLPFSLFLLI